MTAKLRSTENTPTLIITGLITTAATMPSRSRRPAGMRLGTVIVVLALCTFAGSRGWSTAQFAILRSELDHPALVGPLRASVGAPGVTAAALSATLTQMTDPADLDGAAKRLDDLATLLSVRPLS